MQFKTFKEVWGTVTTEADYPSKKAAEAQKEDKASSKLLHSKYAVHYFTCTQPSCRKPRVLYKATPLTAEQKESLARSEDHFMYTCGGPPTAATDPLHSRVVARKTLRCSDPIEFSYYAKHAHFPLCCSTCGVMSSEGNKMARDPDRLALYKVVLPQCERCVRRRLVPPSRVNLNFTPIRRAARADANGEQACSFVRRPCVPDIPSLSPSAQPWTVRTYLILGCSSGGTPAVAADQDDPGDDGSEAGVDSDDLRPSDSDVSNDDGNDGDEPDELSDNEYELEAVVEMHRASGKAMQWLVKWKGYPLNRDDPQSWLRRADFSTERGYEMLLEFERARKKTATQPSRNSRVNTNNVGSNYDDGEEPNDPNSRSKRARVATADDDHDHDHGRDSSQSHTHANDSALPSSTAKRRHGLASTSRLGGAPQPREQNAGPSSSPRDHESSEDDEDGGLNFLANALRRRGGGRGRGRGRGRSRKGALG